MEIYTTDVYVTDAIEISDLIAAPPTPKPQF